MKILIIFNRQPYDGTDVTWNGLRLANKLLEAKHEVRIFLMNDSVDMAREVCKPPEGYDQDLSQMLMLKVCWLRYVELVWFVVEFIKTNLISKVQKKQPCRNWQSGL